MSDTTTADTAATKRETALRRIRGLLDKAESTQYPAEAEALTAKAHALMAAHAVDAALIDATRPGTTETPVARIFEYQAPYGLQKAVLLTRLGDAYGCQVARGRNRAVGKGHVMHIVGFPSDIDAVETLYTSLLIQGYHACTTGDRQYRVSWWSAFATRCGERAAEARAAAVANSEEARAAAGDTARSTSLVLVDRKVEVARAAAREFGRTGKTTTRATSRAGYDAGTAAANRADLGGTRVGTGRAGALGAAR